MKNWFGLLLLLSTTANASCIIYYKDIPSTDTLNDPLYHLLTHASNCPSSPSELKSLIVANGLTEHTYMVANRGRHNSVLGSFSFFESIEGTSAGKPIKNGDFFIGYFTHAVKGALHLDEQPKSNKLLVESIAWDNTKQMFNFYELKSINNNETTWYYRGDSRDAYLDNNRLYRFDPKEEHHFGERMRCSACHNSGGPIMKEASLPNNDWWNQERKLPLSPNVPDANIQTIVESLENPMHLSHSVDAGVKHLFKSDSMHQFRSLLTLQEQLRPLFCTVEINLESANQYKDHVINIPSAFWLNPVLDFPLASNMTMPDYQQLLEEFDMLFPETMDRDADHSWLTPVKGKSDVLAIKDLLKHKVISKSFVDAVLMIDFKNPLFSSSRCQLLTMLPEHATNDWQEIFRQNLMRMGTKEALLLHKYLDNQIPHNYYKQLEKYNAAIQQLLLTDAGRKKIFSSLLHQRDSVSKAEISQNPKSAFKSEAECFRNIKAPTLFIAGEEDLICPPADVRKFADLIPNSQMMIFPEAGHLLALEYPEKLAEVICNFLIMSKVEHSNQKMSHPLYD